MAIWIVLWLAPKDHVGSETGETIGVCRLEVDRAPVSEWPLKFDPENTPQESSIIDKKAVSSEMGKMIQLGPHSTAISRPLFPFRNCCGAHVSVADHANPTGLGGGCGASGGPGT